MRHNCPETSVEKLEMWWELMEKALLQMRKNGKPTPVIIIDHLNHLMSGTSQEGIDLLYLLQDFAEEMADKCLVRMFFTSSEETVYRMLQKSAKSRMSRFPHFHQESPMKKQ